MTTETWSQRKTNNSDWAINSYCYCYGFNLVGDRNSGNIYKLDMSSFTDNGTAITRTIITHPFYSTFGNYSFCDKLQIDFDTTPGSTLSQVNLYISRDGGHTFGSALAANPVQTSDGQWRCYWNRLGKARTWVFKIETSMNAKVIILGASALIRDGGP
jgi:hypothetical protein